MKTKPPASEEKSTVRTYDLVLEYLKGQSYQVQNVDFVEEYFPKA